MKIGIPSSTLPESNCSLDKVIFNSVENPGYLPIKYVQFMGEWYVIDGEAMQPTCFPDIPNYWRKPPALPFRLEKAMPSYAF